ncbi:MAG TPA: hypothetical protein VHY30_09495 [Verrucomicrobiae bacterium]|jgi:hypothetical protein|nr:hypothetical protein [Verrucomicrobiae bacterium]
MPIHINLLAEAQVAEDLRRRDPVKRAIFAGAFFVALALVWSSSLQLEAMIAKENLAQVQAKIQARTNDWQNVLANQKKVFEARGKLAALQQLSSARFLQGNFMNALQQFSLIGVQLTRVRLDQSYFTAPATPNQTSNGHTILGHPATTTEKIVVSLDARDSSANPGDKVDKFKEILASQDYFKAILSRTNGVQLTSLSAPQNGPDGKQYVLFTLECDLPEITR